MFTFTWDDAFENNPTENLSRSSIDDEIRRIKRGIRERMEREHEWGPYSSKNDGSHKAGSVSCLLRGSTIVRDGLVDPQTGAMYLNTDGIGKRLDYYNGTIWEDTLTSTEHNVLADKDDGHPHPQYMLYNGNELHTLNAQGNRITITQPEASNILLGSHAKASLISHDIDDLSCFKEKSIGYKYLKGAIIDSTYTKRLFSDDRPQDREVFESVALPFIGRFQMYNVTWESSISLKSLMRYYTASGIGMALEINKETYNLWVDIRVSKLYFELT